MRWEAGRQGTGYRKLRLHQGSRWDAYLIDYPPGHGIPRHTDPVPGRRHLRINLAMRTGGSRLSADSPLLSVANRLEVFWSDRPHSVSAGRGRRLVLSIGVAL